MVTKGGNEPSAAHIEALDDSKNTTDQDNHFSNNDANEEITRHLQTTSEDIGLTFRTLMAAMSMAMCYNAYLFTLLILPAILTYTNADLGPNPRYTSITISWNLGGAMFVTVGGRLSHIFGRRWFFIAAAIILIIGSVVSATGQSINQIIIGGALFGCGSGFLEMAFGAVQEIVPSKYRHVTIGLFDAASSNLYTYEFSHSRESVEEGCEDQRAMSSVAH